MTLKIQKNPEINITSKILNGLSNHILPAQKHQINNHKNLFFDKNVQKQLNRGREKRKRNTKQAHARSLVKFNAFSLHRNITFLLLLRIEHIRGSQRFFDDNRNSGVDNFNKKNLV
jgi:hypothetical protein